MKRLTCTLAVVALAACGGGNRNQQQAAGEVADSAQADRTPAGTVATDSLQAGKDSSYVAAQRQLDSLHDAGVRPADGIDSAAVRAGNVVGNDPTKDTLVYRKMRVPPKPRH